MSTTILIADEDLLIHISSSMLNPHWPALARFPAIHNLDGVCLAEWFELREQLVRTGYAS